MLNEYVELDVEAAPLQHKISSRASFAVMAAGKSDVGYIDLNVETPEVAGGLAIDAPEECLADYPSACGRRCSASYLLDAGTSGRAAF